MFKNNIIFYFFFSISFLIISFFYLFLSFFCLKFNNFFILKFLITEKMFFIDLNLFIFLDWISTLFMFTVNFISSMIILYSFNYMFNEKKKIKFIILMILFILSMNFLVICPNIFILILGWDGLGLVSFCLIIFFNNENSNSAGILTFMTNRLGDIGIIISIIFMSNFFSWNIINFILEKKMLLIIIPFILLAALTKSAQMPFSAWLPAAMAAPTPVSALVHSSTLVTAGVYLIIRFNLFFSNFFFSEILLIISILTMFFAGLSALFEMDLKKIIALSTLSQLGIMMMILSIGNFNLATFHLLTHAMFKAMLFLCAGAIIHSLNNWQDIRNISQIFNISPFISMSMFIANLSLMGFPFLSGFYSKDLILEIFYSLNNSFLFLTFIILGTLFTSIYNFRLIFFIFKNENYSTSNNFHENFFINFPILFMSFLVIFLGSFISWTSFHQPSFIYLTFFNKLINIFIIMSSFFLFYLISNNKSSFINSIFPNFLGKMWFLENSSILLTPFIKPSKFIFKNSEMWIEYSSSKNIIKESNLLSFYIKNFFFSKINLFMKISLILLIIFLL